MEHIDVNRHPCLKSEKLRKKGEMKCSRLKEK